ncbi:MAG TPA: lytic transglycosylase domain-containing protein [Thermoanaerobaculia bacterium]|nr:lytic transglycosylase domain-containing protein [Thermoanaerobaculia bacterium]
MNRLFLLVVCLAASLASRPALADLVVFDDGRVVKAASYKVVEEELEIGVPGGGSYRVDLSRVERIVEDEIAEACDQTDATLPRLAQNYDLSYRADRKPLFNTAYDQIIAAESRRYGVDASMVSALIRAESNYEPRAVSRKGARGLMQLMPATARRLSLDSPFDPVANVRAGVRYLKELMDRFDHRPDLVLAAYNAGENAVESYGGVPPYRETQGYVKRILSWWTPAVAAAPAGAGPIVKASS